MIVLNTPHGPAQAHLHAADEARAALVLGHGAGGGVTSRDLVAATGAALSEGITVALVEQPYRVAGRRSPLRRTSWTPPGRLSSSNCERESCAGCRSLVGGRSSGARVACRTAAATGAIGVLCLAFPLRPPPRTGKEPGPSRLPELDAVTVPLLVVQGENDRFGIPPAGARRTVVRVQGDHSLRSDLDAVSAAVTTWLRDEFSMLGRS